MSSQVSLTTTIAQNLNFGKNSYLGAFVVNPPIITPYSTYDSLKKNDNYHSTLKDFSTKNNASGRASNILKKFLRWSVAVSVAICVYLKRTSIAEFVRKLSVK